MSVAVSIVENKKIFMGCFPGAAQGNSLSKTSTRERTMSIAVSVVENKKYSWVVSPERRKGSHSQRPEQGNEQCQLQLAL